MMHRCRIVVLLVGLLSAQASTALRSNVRARQLEGYYTFDDNHNGDKPAYEENGGGNYGEGDGHEGGGGAPGGESYGESHGEGDGYGGGKSDSFGGSDSYGESDSNYGSGGDSYGEGGGEGSYGGGDTYGGGDSYGEGGGEGSYGGGDTYGGGDSYGGGGSSDSYSGGYDGGGGGGYHSPSKFNDWMKKVDVQVPIIPVLILGGLMMYCGMVFTAFMYQERPESTFTNCCRLSINTSKTAWSIAFNLYHCRLGEIPPIVCAMDDEDDLSDDEIERMKPRPGIDKALQIEHCKAMARTSIETKSATETPKRFVNLFG